MRKIHGTVIRFLCAYSRFMHIRSPFDNSFSQTLNKIKQQQPTRLSLTYTHIMTARCRRKSPWVTPKDE